MLNKLKEPYVVGVASRVAGQMASFVSVAVASRYLGLDVFGTYALAWAAAVIGNTFVFTGFYQAMLRSQSFEDDRDTAFWLQVCTGAVFMAAISVFGVLAGGLQTAQGFALLAMAPLPFLIVPTAWWEAHLVRAKRVRSASLYVIAAELAALLALIAMFRQGWQIEALILARYVSLAVGLILTGALVRRVPRLRFRRETTRRAAGTTIPLWGSNSVGLFQNYGTDIILGAFTSPETIGVYRGGARISVTASDLVLQPLGVLTWSRFTQIEKNDEGQAALQQAWLINMAFAAAMLWPLSATLVLLAEPLVATVLDESWLPAAGVVVILSISRAILFLSRLLEPTLMITGRARLQFTIRLFGAASLLVLLLAFARFGAEAAAGAHLASSVLLAGVALAAMLRAMKLPVLRLLRCLMPGAGLTAATVLVILATEAPRAALGQGPGLVVSLGLVGLAWLGIVAIFLRRRVLVIPRP